MDFFKWLFHPPTGRTPWIVLIRLFAGFVFLSEGLLKFVYPAFGLGRFKLIGIPFPELSANFVGGLEIVGGICLILGLFTRFFSLLFIIQMIVAILTTKVSLYFGTSPLPPPPIPPQSGIWAVLHETRSDYSQLLACLFLVIVGPGRWSLDRLFFRRNGREERD